MAYKEELTLKAKGIYAYSDTLASVPEGSLQVATNVVLDKNDLISPRRGYETLPGTLSGTINSLHQYTDAEAVNHVLAHRNSSILSYYVDGSDSWTDYTGVYNAPDSATVIRTVESNKNIYFATSKGVQKTDAIGTEPVDAGAPQGLDVDAVLPSASGGTIADGKYAGYRVVWGYKDANDNLILGAPSNRYVFNNASGGVVAPIIRAPIPTPPVTTAWFVQLYRTTAEFTAADDVSDEMQLVLERNPSGAEIIQGYLDLEDQTLDTLRGAALYTNATQEGAINANFQPPQCVDMALFQNHMFYANTETKHELQVTLLNAEAGGSGATVFISGDTITVNGVLYTGGATEDIGLNQFKVGPQAPPNTAEAIEETAKSLVNVINRSASNTALWAVYDSSVGGLPGLIRIFERDFGDAIDFTVISSKGDAFSPSLVTAETSTNNKTPNRLYYSKIQEPEAVPLLNFFDVGPANKSIKRILALRSILLIFTDDGVYRLTGTTSSTFQVTLLDGTTKLIAPESLVLLNNTATGLFDQGVAQVSSTSVQVISRPIEGKLLALRGATGDNLESFAFGISYESDRKYILSVPQRATDTANSIMYVYNTVTSSWTTYDLARTTGLVREEDDKLYFASDSTIHRERKNFNETDFADDGIAVTVNSVSGDNTTLTLTSVVGLSVGYLYYESAAAFSIITAIDTLNSTITVQDSLPWATGVYEVRPFITTTIQWNPISADSPNLLKQWSECTLLVEFPLQNAELAFKTVISGNFEAVNLTDTPIGLWGLFPWGDVPWGGEVGRTRYRTYIPRAKQKDTLIIPKLTQNTVFSPFEISGLSFYYRVISNRTGR